MTCIVCYAYIVSVRNMLICLIFIELSFVGINIFLVSTACFLDNVSGHTFALFLVALGTSEMAIGLGVFVAYSNNFLNIDLYFEEEETQYRLHPKYQHERSLAYFSKWSDF